MIVVDQVPIGATRIAPVEAALVGLDEGVDHVRIAAGNGDADAAERTFGQAITFDPLPRIAVVSGAIEAVLCTTAV